MIYDHVCTHMYDVVYFDNQLKQLLAACTPCQPASLALPCYQSGQASLQVGTW